MTAATPHPDPLVELLALPDPQERLAWIIDRAKSLPAFAPDERVPANRVPGCVSAVWLIDESSHGVGRFRADAEAPVLRGLSCLICERSTGRRFGDLVAEEIDVVQALHLERHLSPTRTHGLRRLQDHVRRLAADHFADESP